MALQLGITKGGPTHLFGSYKPLKIRSTPNRLKASIGHDEVAYRPKLDRTLDSKSFSYIREMPPAPHTLPTVARVPRGAGSYCRHG